MSDPVHHHRSRVAAAVRGRRPADADAARRDLTAALCERAIRQALTAEHPPTPEQRQYLAALLSGGAR